MEDISACEHAYTLQFARGTLLANAGYLAAIYVRLVQSIHPISFENMFFLLKFLGS